MSSGPTLKQILSPKRWLSLGFSALLIAHGEPVIATEVAGQDKSSELVFEVTYVGDADGWAPIPFERFKNEIFIKAKINGAEANVLIDNGTGNSQIDQDFARKIGLKIGKSIEPSNTGNALIPRALTDKVVFDIPHHVRISGGMTSASLRSFSSLMGRQVDAILGGDLLKSMAMFVQTSTNQLFLVPSGKIKPNGGITIPLVNESEVEVTIDGKPARLYIDFGSNSEIMLSDDAWSRLIPSGNSVKEGHHAGGDGLLRSALHSDGHTLQIGGVTARGVDIFKTGKNPVGSDGLLGQGFFSHFDVIFDHNSKFLTLIQLRPPVSPTSSGRPSQH